MQWMLSPPNKCFTGVDSCPDPASRHPGENYSDGFGFPPMPCATGGHSLDLVNEPSIIARSVEKAHIWLNEVAEELGTDDHGQAYRVLRAYLHALRDRLPVNEAAQLAAQLPELIRGIYYEGWKPSATPVRYRDLADFLDRVAEDAILEGETSASYAVSAVSAVLRRHVSAGEIEDVRAILPEELRPILD